MLCLKLAFFTCHGPILVLSGTNLPCIILLSWDIVHLSSLPGLSLRKHQELLEHKYDFEQSHRFFSEVCVCGALFPDCFNVNFNGYWPFSLPESNFMAHSHLEKLRPCPWLPAGQMSSGCVSLTMTVLESFSTMFAGHSCLFWTLQLMLILPEFLVSTWGSASMHSFQFCSQQWLCLPFATKLFCIFVSLLVVNYSVIPLTI